MDLKLEKWEPTRAGRIPDGFIPIYKSGIIIPAWAWKHIRSDLVDLYCDLKARVIGIKPSGNTRKLRKQSSGRGKIVTCRELIRGFGIENRQLCKAEWSKTHKMLLVHLEG